MSRESMHEITILVRSVLCKEAQRLLAISIVIIIRKQREHPSFISYHSFNHLTQSLSGVLRRYNGRGAMAWYSNSLYLGHTKKWVWGVVGPLAENDVAADVAAKVCYSIGLAVVKLAFCPSERGPSNLGRRAVKRTKIALGAVKDEGNVPCHSCKQDLDCQTS